LLFIESVKSAENFNSGTEDPRAATAYARFD